MNACKPWLLSLLLALPLSAGAHSSSQAYLDLRASEGGALLRVDLALRDLDATLDLDANADGQLSWGEVQAAQPAIERYALAGLRLQGCAAGFSPKGFGLERRADGVYAALQLQAPCHIGVGAVLRYTLLGELDPTHRALLRLSREQKEPELSLLHPLQPSEWLEPPPLPTPPPTAAPQPQALEQPPHPVPHAAAPSFWREGMHHLVTGYDHLLFLLCLLLPAVLARRRSAPGWKPLRRPGEALGAVLGIVSAFTLAHSLTLALAAYGRVQLLPQWIEPAIALSIVLAALDNLRPFLPGPRWGVALGFGLVHGFGFAGVLAELELPAGALAWALLQFNLGLELAQVGLVLLAMGLLWALRRWAGYPRWVLGLGSTLAAAMGSLWVVQRLA
ncbi:HupE/UreJ family protein [Inhella proteolytica]|uniref:HupE/UreJ family protein n=1 Tax=Inhella proteolytica TaxID=2795029 RepID=A0A931NGE4_9BURK|nr:HupE/UreJ family protein [Inhella proteolytica]MBH9576618.1 HupE/UreJ family protein [Inhella proteolytica]